MVFTKRYCLEFPQLSCFYIAAEQCGSQKYLVLAPFLSSVYRIVVGNLVGNGLLVCPRRSGLSICRP